MKLFSVQQIKACEHYSMQEADTDEAGLVSRAGTATAEFLKTRYRQETPFVFLCGLGNNGADGLAAARILHLSGYAVKVFVLQHSGRMSEVQKANLNKLLLLNASLADYVPQDTFIADVPSNAIIVDAILGLGLSRPPEGWLSEFIEYVNRLPNECIALDVPSGLPADTISAPGSSIIRATTTLSFQFYKRCFLHAEAAAYCGTIVVLDIGLSKHFIERTQSLYQTLEPERVQHLLAPRDAFANKYHYGHLLCAAGKKGMAGAAILSVRSALRSGVGLVSALTPDAAYTALQTAAPEAMVHVSGNEYIEDFPVPGKATAVCAGPGMGTEPATANAFLNFLSKTELPCVLDADALNILAQAPDRLHHIPENSVLTPHEGECARLFGPAANSMQRLEQLRMKAIQYKVCIVLKGRYTAIVCPEGEVFYNTTGNPGMAKGGSGDVLTGLLGGLLAQGMKAADAACLAVYLHGSAGDLAAGFLGEDAMNAGDIIMQLSAARQKLAKM